MSEKVEKHEVFLQPFLLFRNDVESIWDYFSNIDGLEVLKIWVECADDVSIRFDSKEELLDYRNEFEKRILNLRFVLILREQSLEHCSLCLCEDSSRDAPLNNVRLHIAGDDEERVRSVSHTLKDIIVSSQPWYHRFRKLELLVRILVAFTGFVALRSINFQVYDSPFGQTNLGWTEATTEIYVYAFAFIFILWTIFAGNLAVNYWRKIFPIGKFIIGKEAITERNREWQRRTVLTILATSIIGVFVSI